MTFYLSNVLKINFPQIAVEVHPLKRIPVTYWVRVTLVKSVAKNKPEISTQQPTSTVSNRP